MNDFEEIYKKIYSKFKEKEEELNKDINDIEKYALNNVLKLLTVIVITLLIIVFVTKNANFLILLILVPGPLFLYYCTLASKKISTSITPKMNVMDQIYNTFINEAFNGLKYSNNGLNYSNRKKGLSFETYKKGKYEKCEVYESYAELEGILNKKNEIKLSYVVASKGDKRFDNYSCLFRGYFLEAKLNKSTNTYVKINAKEFEYLYQQNSNREVDKIINDIQNIINQFKEKNKIDITICNDKLYIRFYTNPFGYFGGYYGYNYSIKVLNKDNLKKYYNGISTIIELTNKIINTIKKNYENE